MIQCSIDGLPFTACTSPVTYTHLEAGDHEFMVQAIGADGQIQLVPTLYEWEVILPPDTTPPDTTITRGRAGADGELHHCFEFTGIDDQTARRSSSTSSARSTAGRSRAASSPEEVEVLTAGEHTFAVRAIDEAGNVDPTPATRTWTVVDLSAPDTSIELGPDSETEATSATFEFTGEEELTGEPVFEFECSLDNAEFVACTSPHQVTGLAGRPARLAGPRQGPAPASSTRRRTSTSG